MKATVTEFLPLNPHLENELAEVLSGLRFPAWVETEDRRCLFSNEARLAERVVCAGIREQSGAVIHQGPTGGPVWLRTAKGEEFSVSVAVYPVIFAQGTGKGGTLRILVICLPEAAGERDREISLALWGRLLRGHAAAEEERLTPQQRLVYRHLKQGLSYKEIASSLGVAHTTIRVQVATLRKLLGKEQVPVLRR